MKKIFLPLFLILILINLNSCTSSNPKGNLAVKVENDCESEAFESPTSPLMFCEISFEKAREKLLGYLEFQTFGDYVIMTQHGFWEMERWNSRLIIKNKQNGKIFMSNKIVWDATFSSDNKSIIAGVEFWPGTIGDEDPQLAATNIEKLSKILNVQPAEIKKFLWETDGFAPMKTFSILTKISLPDLKVEYLPYFGGEEIAIKNNRIIFTQYADMGQKCCYFNYCDNLREEIQNYMDQESYCEQNHVPVLEINVDDDQKSSSYQKSLGEIHGQKNMVVSEEMTVSEEGDKHWEQVKIFLNDNEW